MKTEKTNIHKRICICRECNGTGTVVKYDLKDVRRLNPQIETCPQCNGSGRVWVSGEVIKKIEPYED